MQTSTPLADIRIGPSENGNYYILFPGGSPIPVAAAIGTVLESMQAAIKTLQEVKPNGKESHESERTGQGTSGKETKRKPTPA